MILNTFQSNEIEEIWPQIEPFIKKVLQKIDLCYTVEDIKSALCKRKMQLWTSHAGKQIYGICITQILIHPQYKFLEIVLLSGEGLKNYFHHFDTIESWAKEQGCQKIKLVGRKGWAKKLPDYKQKLIKLEKDL